MSISDEKLVSLLEFYRVSLNSASNPPIDHVACIRLLAKIDILENLLIYSKTDAQSAEVIRRAAREEATRKAEAG